VGTHGESGDGIRRLVARTRELTDRPFGVNVLIVQDPDAIELDRALPLEEVGTAVAERVAAVVLFWDPAPYLEQLAAPGSGSSSRSGRSPRRRRRLPPASMR
jgi:hypothetical protein